MTAVKACLGAGLLVLVSFMLIPLSIAALPADGGGLDEEALGGIVNVRIDGDSDLISQAAANSWPGNGTPSDPYTIANMTLICNDTAAAIEIINTTLSIEFFNITVQDDRVSEYHPLVILDNVTGLRLEGVRARSPTDESVVISRSADLVVEDSAFGTVLISDSAQVLIGNTTIDWTNGFIADRCTDLQFLRNNIDHVSFFALRDCERSTFTNNTFNYVVYGLTFSISKNMTLWSNTFLDCSLCPLRDADRIWYTDSFHTLVAPANNTVNGLPLIFIQDTDLGGANVPSAAGQVLLLNVSNAVISGRSFSSVSNALTAVECRNLSVLSNSISWTLRGIMVDDSEGVHLQDNILNHCYDGIVARRCGGLLISQNWLNGSYRDIMVNMQNAGDYAILLSSQDNGQVIDNVIGSYWWGPMADGSSGVEFSRNEVIRAFYGLIGTRSHHLLLSSNTIGNADYGIVLALVQSSTVADNSISGAEYGCYLNDGDGNRITGNRITGSSRYGIYAVSTSSGNVILGNVLRSNNGAGTVYSSSAIQAKDDGSGNVWSNSWGGNKWGDWSGPDADNDSYVDSPYVISGRANARDHYPYASHTTVVDDIPPTLVITSPANGSWQSSLRGYFYWQGSDSQTSIFKYFGNLGGSGWFDLGLRTEWNRTLGEGRQEMAFMAVDMAGNRVIQQVVIFIDTRAPVITVEPIGQFVSSPDVWVNWTVVDSGIGLDKVELSLDDGDWVNVTSVNSYLITDLSGSTVHNIRLRATDRMGWARTVSINTTLDTAYDHLEILSPSGELTNAEAITVEWETYDLVSQTSRVEISVDGQAWSEVSGTSHALSGLGDGEHTIQVRAWDHAGNCATRSTTVIVDRTAPDLLISSPLPGAVLGSSDVHVGWESSDTHGFTCQYRLDLGQWTSVTDDFTVLALADGAHTIELSCRDGAGNFANRSVEFTVDTHHPVVSITSPSPGAYINRSAVTLTWSVWDTSAVEMDWRVDGGDWSSVHEMSVVISGLSEGTHVFELSCQDSVGLYTNTTLEFTVDTTAPSVTIVSPEGGWYAARSIEVRWVAADQEGIDHFRLEAGGSWTDLPGDVLSRQITDLMDGPHTIVVTALDLAGNSNSTEITIWIDATAPALQIISPSAGSFGNSISLTVEWTVSDLVGIGSVWLRFDDGPWVNVTSMTSYVSDSLSEGVHTITFNATDALGNYAVSSFTHTIDLTPPFMEITAPAEGEFLGPSVRVSWAASDDRGISRSATRLDGGPWQDVQASSRYKVFSGLAGGLHTIEVMVVDLAGNALCDTVTFEVDSTAPFLSVTSPSDHAYLGTGTVEVTWTSFDDGTGMDRHSVSCDGTSWTDVEGTSFTFHLPDGTYALSVRAYDLVGNMAEVSLTVVVDTAGPSVMMISPSDGSFGNDTGLMARWAADDVTSGIGHYEISVDGATGIRVNGTELLIEGLSEGAHTLNVKAYDLAGNAGEVTVAFIVDLTSPSLSITSPAEAEITNAINISTVWTSSDEVGISYFQLRLDAGATMTLAAGATSCSLAMVPEGQHLLALMATDLAGNSRTVTVSFVVDRTAPSAECRLSGDPHSDSWNVTVEMSEPISADGISMSVNGVPHIPSLMGACLLIVDMDAPIAGEVVTVTVSSIDLAGNIAELSWAMEAPFPTLTVSGRIIDENGAIMAGALVYCDGTLVTEADPQGNFSFDIAPGVHNLVVLKDGHLPANLTFDANATSGTSVGLIVLTIESDGRSFGSGIGTILIVAALAAVILVGAILVSLIRNRKS